MGGGCSRDAIDKLIEPPISYTYDNNKMQK